MISLLGSKSLQFEPVCRVQTGRTGERNHFVIVYCPGCSQLAEMKVVSKAHRYRGESGRLNSSSALPQTSCGSPGEEGHLITPHFCKGGSNFLPHNGAVKLKSQAWVKHTDVNGTAGTQQLPWLLTFHPFPRAGSEQPVLLQGCCWAWVLLSSLLPSVLVPVRNPKVRLLNLWRS